MLIYMATRGRKPKPIEQKVRLGNPSGRKLPVTAKIIQLPIVAHVIPEPHRPLMGTSSGALGAGQQLWAHIWESACPWLNKNIDTELVMLICEQTDERTLLRDRMFRIGLEWRDRAALRQLEKLIASNLAQLGFTPTDRARLGISNQPSDALQEFRAKVTAKRVSTT